MPAIPLVGVEEEKILAAITIKHPSGDHERFMTLEMNVKTGACELASRSPRMQTAALLRRLDELAELVQAAKRAILTGSI